MKSAPTPEQKRKLDQLLSTVRWARALRFTECCMLAAVVVSMFIDDQRISIPLAIAGAFTYFLARVVSSRS